MELAEETRKREIEVIKRLYELGYDEEEIKIILLSALKEVIDEKYNTL